jgi:glycosyltransferase involved in cell wall biosynthesis
MIDSVRAQTFLDWELLIVNDGSTDGGDILARTSAAQDARVTVIDGANAGPGAARNRGVAAASGEWILFLDADDLIAPLHLAELLAAAARRCTADIVAAGWQEFRDGQPAELATKLPAGLDAPISCLRDSAVAFAPWAVHAALVRRAVLTGGRRWPEHLDLLLGEDIAFWFALIIDCDVTYSRTNGALYRRLPASRTNFEPRRWFDGVHVAVRENLALLQRSDRPLTLGHAEHLMRLYSGIYRLALDSSDAVVAEAALTEADGWLRRCCQLGGSRRFSIRIRAAIGLKLFSRLRKR